MKNIFQRIRGFTLIELLIVIAIIAILTVVILSSLSGAKAKSRDGKRVSDVSQIQLALEQYFDRCNAYPSLIYSSNGTDCTGVPGLLFSPLLITTVPTPPTGGSVSATTYDYAVNAGRTDYVLHAQLETNNIDVLKNSLQQGSQSFSTSFTCYNGGANGSVYDYCVGPK